MRFSYVGPIAGELGKVTLCHCAQCRRAQGYGSAAAPVLAERLLWVCGAEAVREYESSPGKLRAFCGLCGSPLYSRRPASPTVLRLRLGALDAAPQGIRVEAHIFTAGAPAWSLPSDAPCYDAEEPGRP